MVFFFKPNIVFNKVSINSQTLSQTFQGIFSQQHKKTNTLIKLYMFLSNSQAFSQETPTRPHNKRYKHENRKFTD